MSPNGNLKNPFKLLTEKQLILLHDASLKIMDRTGMRFHSQKAIDLFKKAGARVTDGNLIQIPPTLVEWALNTVPKELIIYDRNGQEAMFLGSSQTYFGVGSDCMFIYDLGTGERRKAVMEDVIHGVRLADGLPNIDFMMSMFLPSDVPNETYERHQMEAILRGSTKPIVYVGLEASSTRYAVEMASAVVGGLRSLQHSPFIINYINTTSAFQHDGENIERLLFSAERNLPTCYAPGNSCGTTAPMTVAGMLALGNAGQLAGLVLSQIQREGSPFILNNPSCGKMDMSSLIDLYSTPDLGNSSWTLARRYGLPVLCSAGCSNAKVFDAQAAAEATLTLFANMIGGVNLNSNIGYLDSAMTGSLELVAFCDEIIGWIKHYLKELVVDDETLALDLIHEVGPDGHFLATEHTLHHVRDDWQPTLFERRSYDQWSTEGEMTLLQRANQKVRDILQNHRAEPLIDEVIDKLSKICSV
jgi:trimethylamine--corrinoid protein Co-methyltransferase